MENLYFYADASSSFGVGRMIIPCKYPVKLVRLAKTNDTEKFLLKSYLLLETISNNWIPSYTYCAFRVRPHLSEEVKGSIEEAKLKLIKYIEDELEKKVHIETNTPTKYFLNGKEIGPIEELCPHEGDSGEDFVKLKQYDLMVTTTAVSSYQITGKWKPHPETKKKRWLKHEN